MLRDFTEASYNSLVRLTQEVEDEKWCDFTDYLGDRALDAEAWIGCLDINHYLNDLSKYHKKVIDKNNTSKDEIRNIFIRVNEIDTEFCNRFISLYVSYEEYKNAMLALINVISPTSDSFTAEYIGNGLKSYIDKQKMYMQLCRQAANTGISKDDIPDQETADAITDKYLNYLFQLCPNAELGAEFEIPLGPGVTLYYSIKGQVDTGSGVKISDVIVDHQNKLSVEFKDKTGWEVSYDLDDGLSFAHEDGNTGYKTSFNPGLNEVSFERSVTTNFGEYGAIESTVGIKIEHNDDNNNRFRPLPEPVPVTSPYPAQVPQFDVDWHAVRNVAITGGAIILTGIAIGAFIYCTGGAGALVLVAV